MSKAVLISIRPKWCQLIAIEEKTVEIRKTRPKLETPFKVYIYATKAAKDEPFSYCVQKSYDSACGKAYRYSGGGEVIGEFVCDRIEDIMISCSDLDMRGIPFPGTGLTDREIMDYLGNGKTGFFWHISNLKIYYNAKSMTEFMKPCKSDLYCESCGMYSEFSEQCNNKALILYKAPQSWCYVKELEE